MPQLGRITALAFVALGAAVAVGAVAGLLAARQGYEDELAAAYELEAAGARLLAAGLAEESALGQRGRGAPDARSRAQADFDAEAARAMKLSKGDQASERLVGQRLAAQRELRDVRPEGVPGQPGLVQRGQLAVATLEARRTTQELTDRQRRRREDASDEAAGETRVWLAVAGAGLAFVLAVAGAPRQL